MSNVSNIRIAANAARGGATVEANVGAGVTHIEFNGSEYTAELFNSDGDIVEFFASEVLTNVWSDIEGFSGMGVDLI